MSDLVKDWCSKKVIATSDDESIQKVVDAMKKYDISGLLVVDTDSVPVGMITAKDLVTRVMARNLPITTKVAEVMTRGVVHTIKSTNTIMDASGIMLEKRIKHLAVVDKSGATVGMLTISDIIRFCANSAKNSVIDEETSTQTLQDIETLLEDLKSM